MNLKQADKLAGFLCLLTLVVLIMTVFVGCNGKVSADWTFCIQPEGRLATCPPAIVSKRTASELVIHVTYPDGKPWVLIEAKSNDGKIYKGQTWDKSGRMDIYLEFIDSSRAYGWVRDPDTKTKTTAMLSKN